MKDFKGSPLEIKLFIIFSFLICFFNFLFVLGFGREEIGHYWSNGVVTANGFTFLFIMAVTLVNHRNPKPKSTYLGILIVLALYCITGTLIFNSHSTYVTQISSYRYNFEYERNLYWLSIVISIFWFGLFLFSKNIKYYIKSKQSLS